MTGKLLFTFNAGSSTVKIGMFALEQAGARRIGKGMIDFRRAPLRFTLSEGPDTFDIALETRADAELQNILQEAFQRLSWHFDLDSVAAIGHRVVHGGDRFAGPVRLDGDSIAAIEALTVLAPLHQPQSLRLVRAIGSVLPDLPQVASFDTAFHRTNDALVRRFAIPRDGEGD